MRAQSGNSRGVGPIPREVFRGANARIRDAAVEHGMEAAVPFVCECDDVSCTEIVQISVAEYDAIRTDPRGTVLVTGHVTADGVAASG